MSTLTMQDLYYHILLYGHDPDLSKLTLTQPITNYAKSISEIDLIPFDGRELSYISKLQLFDNAQRFMNEKFRLHPVGFLTDERIGRILRSKRIQSVDDIPRIYNKSAKMMNPFELPLNYRIDSVFGGSLVAQNVVTEDTKYYEDMLPKLNLYFSEIAMPKVLTTAAPTTLVHEITHSQLASQKGIIENYYNGEVLSIFMEFLHSYETDPTVFTIDFVNRLQNILVNFYSMYIYEAGRKNPEREYGEYDYFSDSQYLISIAKAIAMIHKYLNSNEKIRKSMIQGIQNVFDGKNTLEDYLEAIDIDLDSSWDPKYPLEMVKKLS